MKRFLLIGMGLCLLAISITANAQPRAKVTIKLAYFFQPSFEAFLYAVKQGKVKSDLVKLEYFPLEIAALIQATGTKQYDIVETAVIGLPRAKARGLNLTILGTSIIRRPGSQEIVVRSDSPISSIKELKGKTMAVSALGSTATLVARVVLEKTYGLTTGISGKGADLTLIQVPLTAIPVLIQRGKVDAAYILGAPGYKALKAGAYKVLARVGTDFKKTFGSFAAISMWVTYPERVRKNPAAFREVMRMLRESRDYMFAHPREVYAAVAKKYRADPELLKLYFESWNFMGLSLDDEHMKMIERSWQIAKEAGYIKGYPPIREVIFR